MKGKRLIVVSAVSIIVIAGIVLGLFFAFRPPAAIGAISDDLGRTVVIDRIPQRIVSLAPASTEILFALGLGDKIVGVTDECDYPEQAKAKSSVGPYGFVSPEKIIDLRPDLILSDGWPWDVVLQLETLGYPVIVLQPKDIDGIFRNIELIGKVTGAEKQAAELITDMQNRIGAIAAKTAAASRPTVYYEMDVGFWTGGAGSFIDALIILAGGNNIAAGAPAWAMLSNEVIIDAKPDIIVLGYMIKGTESVDEVRNRSGWSEIPAVSNNKIYIIDSDLILRPGPRVIQGLEQLAQIIHPELF